MPCNQTGLVCIANEPRIINYLPYKSWLCVTAYLIKDLHKLLVLLKKRVQWKRYQFCSLTFNNMFFFTITFSHIIRLAQILNIKHYLISDRFLFIINYFFLHIQKGFPKSTQTRQDVVRCCRFFVKSLIIITFFLYRQPISL